MKEHNSSQLSSHNQDSCPECRKGSLIKDTENGESVCNRCGFVAPERLIDASSDSNDFIQKEISLIKSSSISNIDEDHYGRNLSGEMQNLFKRLRQRDFRVAVHESRDRNLRHATPLVKSWCSELGLSDDAAFRVIAIYAKALELDLMLGRSLESLAAASIYALCRTEGIPRTSKAIAQISGTREKSLKQAYRTMYWALNLKPPLIEFKNFLPALGAKLNVPEKFVRETAMVIALAQERGLWEGKSPMAFVGAALYITIRKARIKIPQPVIAKAANVSPVSLRNNSKPIREMLLKIKEENGEINLSGIARKVEKEPLPKAKRIIKSGA